MSGFKYEVIVRLKDNMTQSQVIESFVDGLKLYFGNKIFPKIEEGGLYFFQNAAGAERLYSFVLDFEEESEKLVYFSFIDNSSNTSSLFMDNSFFYTMCKELKKIGKKIILLSDPDYDSIREVFDLNIEGALAFTDLEKPS